MPTSDALPRKTIVLLIVAAVIVVLVFIGGLAFGGSSSGGGADARDRLDEWVSPAPLPLTDLSSANPDDCPAAATLTFRGSCRYDVAPDESGPFGLGLARALTVTNTGTEDVQLQLDVGGRLIPEDPDDVPDAALEPQESSELTFGPDAAAFTTICTAVGPFDCTVTFTADP
jgi:hypothetical protein